MAQNLYMIIDLGKLCKFSTTYFVEFKKATSHTTIFICLPTADND